MSDPCLIHVLSKEQIDILLKNYDGVKIAWRSKYCRLLKYYLKICSTCQKLDTGNDQEEETLLENLETFIAFMRPMIEIMSESCEMKNAMTLMLCNYPRCTNHTSWDQKLDRSFMNWVSHRVSEMGHSKLGISNKDCMKLGASSFEEIKNNVTNCIQPYLVNKMNEDNFLDNLNFAQRCYGIDYEMRELRHPSNGVPLCGERVDSKHEFRRNLARALSLVVSDWIVEQEESNNKRQRI